MVTIKRGVDLANEPVNSGIYLPVFLTMELISRSLDYRDVLIKKVVFVKKPAFSYTQSYSIFLETFSRRHIIWMSNTLVCILSLFLFPGMYFGYYYFPLLAPNYYILFCVISILYRTLSWMVRLLAEWWKVNWRILFSILPIYFYIHWLLLILSSMCDQLGSYLQNEK